MKQLIQFLLTAACFNNGFQYVRHGAEHHHVVYFVMLLQKHSLPKNTRRHKTSKKRPNGECNNIYLIRSIPCRKPINVRRLLISEDIKVDTYMCVWLNKIIWPPLTGFYLSSLLPPSPPSQKNTSPALPVLATKNTLRVPSLIVFDNQGLT